MKLLTTIAAVLISISAFSQDYVEYDNGTFTQNGEQLSMEQINDLTLSYNTGIGDFRRGNRFGDLHKYQNYRIANNTLNFIGGAATGYFGGIGVFLTYIISIDGVRQVMNVPAFTVLAGASTGLCVVSYKAFSSIVSKKGCLRKRDRQFNKVAEKINQAIKAADQ